MVLHGGGPGQGINAGGPAYEAALKTTGTRYELLVYEDEDVNLACNNDASPACCNAEAARLARERRLRSFKEKSGVAGQPRQILRHLCSLYRWLCRGKSSLFCWRLCC